MSGLFDGYEQGEFFDELFTVGGDVRPHYAALVRRMGTFTSDELRRREQLRDLAFRQAGITFTVYGENEGIERTFPLDLIPRIIPADEWATIEAGLVQRVSVLNQFLDDLYVGDRLAVEVQTHAWFEAAVPGHGWLALDPTNALQVGDRHIAIGVGREYDDVPPIRGVYRGTGVASVEAHVEIRRQSAQQQQ